MASFHVFLSYARADNGANADGWVTAFHDRLLAQHARYSGRRLEVFFDKQAIKDGQDWERRIYTGLRESRLFLAFLSPNYLKSEWCRREWESYLRLEHSLARGDDGIKQIYFAMVPEIHGSRADAADLQSEMADWISDMRRRNRGHAFDLRDWYGAGPQILAEIDAADRLATLRAKPRSDGDRRLVALADRVAEIDSAIAHRLDRAALAELALEQGNIGRSYPHFVGRHRELRQLHDNLTSKHRVGVISALHGLGGQGKTALAEQYSYAYAEHYAAGGRWKLPCEGQTSLAAALEPLVRGLGLPNDATAEERVRLTLTALRERTRANVETIRQQLSQLPGLHTPDGARPTVEANTLLILDNVDREELLSSREAAQIFAEPWLKIVVTTRHGPHSFGIDPASLAAIPVDDLPPEDALALIRDYRSLDDPAEVAAAREIVRRIGGFTLAVEIVAAYLAAHEASGLTVAGYLQRLIREGIGSTDALSEDRR
ncbi:MAG TPA: hypothetical protein DCY26_14645, partial [Hyphomonas sp.]|nr:hypothetical protein [Hyphomonas sp.]